MVGHSAEKFVFPVLKLHFSTTSYLHNPWLARYSPVHRSRLLLIKSSRYNFRGGKVSCLLPLFLALWKKGEGRKVGCKTEDVVYSEERRKGKLQN